MEEIEQKINSLAGASSERPIPPAARQAPPSAPSVRDGSFGEELNRLIQSKGAEHGVSPDLLRAVIKAESGGQVHARSQKGALGLMQLMPATAADLGVNPREPTQNVDGGSRYLKEMGQRFGTLDQALAAYNAGPGAVEKHGGVPPYRETKAYIRKVRALLQDGNNPKDRGNLIDRRR